MNEISLNKLLETKKLFLVGFMATGKTTIGKRLSSKLNLPFLDSDKEIENHLQTSISEIFRVYGENKFREIEKKIILDKINNNHINGFVMSLGGGAFLNSKIRELINSKGISIWLNANIDIISNRIANSKNERPLTLKYNSKKKLEILLRERIIYYQLANIKVNVINTSKENMTKIILKKINKHIMSKND